MLPDFAHAIVAVPMHGFDSVLETAYISSLLCGKPSHDLNTGPMYHVSMEEAPSGAAWLETNCHFL
jgi:hypothetical protein